MARIRSLNPCAPVDEDVATMSLVARYLWAYLPCHADREGRLKDSAFMLKNAVLPTETIEAVEACLRELAEQRHIVRYEVGGRRFIQIRSFHRHQKPHSREVPSMIPAPPTQVVPEHDLGSDALPPGSAGVSSSPGIPDPDPDPDPGPDPGPDQGPTTQAVYKSPKPAPVGAASLAFVAVANAYPNKNGRAAAAGEFQRQADGHPGGERGLAAEILVALPALLKGHPYSGGARFCPNLERFLAERRWTDEPTQEAPEARSESPAHRIIPKPQPFAPRPPRPDEATPPRSADGS